MSDFDDELHARLTARADVVSGERDWDDLIVRMTRRSRRANRALSLALVLTLCVSTVAVVVAARRDEPSAPKAKARVAATDRVDATHAPVPRVSVASGATYATLNGPNATGTLGILTKPMSPPAVISAGGMLSVIGPDTFDMARVFTRTTASGETIRAYRADVANPGGAQGPPWWTPPGWCFPNGYVQADVSDDAVAGVGFAPLFAEQKGNAKVGGSVTVIGMNEKAVRLVVVAQGSAGTARLRATFPDGSQDEMTPVDGVAVFVGHGTTDPAAKVTLTALDASGASLGTATVTANTGWLSNAVAGDCTAPQTLPPPGAQQPADAAAARAAVVDTFTRAYAMGVNTTDFEKYWEDPHGFADILAKLRAGTFKEQVNTAKMKLNDVVFLSPTVAAIQYEIDIPNYGTPSFSPRFNEAHLVGGTWKLARAGFCNDVSLAGVQCG